MIDALIIVFIVLLVIGGHIMSGVGALYLISPLGRQVGQRFWLAAAAAITPLGLLFVNRYGTISAYIVSGIAAFLFVVFIARCVNASSFTRRTVFVAILMGVASIHGNVVTIAFISQMSDPCWYGTCV